MRLVRVVGFGSTATDPLEHLLSLNQLLVLIDWPPAEKPDVAPDRRYRIAVIHPVPLPVGVVADDVSALSDQCRVRLVADFHARLHHLSWEPAAAQVQSVVVVEAAYDGGISIPLVDTWRRRFCHRDQSRIYKFQ